MRQPADHWEGPTADQTSGHQLGNAPAPAELQAARTGLTKTSGKASRNTRVNTHGATMPQGPCIAHENAGGQTQRPAIANTPGDGLRQAHDQAHGQAHDNTTGAATEGVRAHTHGSAVGRTAANRRQQPRASTRGTAARQAVGTPQVTPHGQTESTPGGTPRLQADERTGRQGWGITRWHEARQPQGNKHGHARGHAARQQAWVAAGDGGGNT